MAQEFFSALQGSDAARAGDPLAPFGQFIGAWDVDVVWLEDGNVVRREPGEWHFASILGGRAIQDVWIVPPRGAPGAASYEYGTSLRFPDPAGGGLWRSTWHGPVHGVVIPFTAQLKGDMIVLRGTHPDGRPLTWHFSDITPTRFIWQNRSSPDQGATWQLTQEFVATRR